MSRRRPVPDLSVRWEPEVLARVVADELARRADAGDGKLALRYRAQIEPLYSEPPETREAAFHRLDEATAQGLGIDARLLEEAAAADWPSGSVRELLVSPANRASDEGTDLTPSEGGATVVIRLRPTSLSNEEWLAAFLRHEFAHIADLLDPEFGYDGDRRVGPGAGSEALVRDRYRALWCASIDVRLEAEGKSERGAASIAVVVGIFGLNSDAAGPLARWLGGPRPTHRVFMACACRPSTLPEHCPGAGLPRESARSALCPVCKLPAHPGCRDGDDLPKAVIETLRRDLPGWSVHDGLCDRCREVYLVQGANP